MISSDLPLVSIGIPYYNSQDYILYTLESVKCQSYKNIELVLVNDCSTDNSQAIVDEWVSLNKTRFSNVIQITNPVNKGVAYSCKVLQGFSSGILFTKLDADDIILPHKILDQASYLKANPDVAMVYSNTIRIDSKGALLQEDYFTHQKFQVVRNNRGPSGYIFPQLLIEDFIPASSVLIRKSALDCCGGYDENLYIEDWDMWLRLSKHYRIDFLPGYFSQYRIHPQSMMQKKESLIKVYGSLITALLKHLKISDEFDKIIAKHLYTYAVGMYRFGEINKDFLKINFTYNKNFKSRMYYVLGLMNIKINSEGWIKRALINYSFSRDKNNT